MRLRVEGLAKAFGPTHALRSCSFAVPAGEVHAVVGENGSGKSTMVKILTGVLRPDRGTIEIGGAATAGLRSPSAAIAAGIVGVFQNTMVVGPRSVLDNLWLGTDGLLRRAAPDAVRRARGSEVLRELLGSEPDLDAPAETLPLSERQACAVARALLRDPDVLILDEATSALDVATRERLFGILGRLACTGKSVVFISHRMDEVEEIGDAITVLRAGETVATVRRGESSSRELVALMTGAERLPERRLLEDGGARIRSQGEPLLAARGLVLRPGAVPVDATIRPGELVGVAGLEGHGQERFLHALAGARAAGGDVLVSTSNGPMALRSRRQATQHGVAYLPRDRQSSGVFEALSVRDNFGLPTLPADRRAGFVSNARTGRRLADYVARLRITLADSRREITTLSGGNQQKVVLARWLAVRPRALLLNDPTRGIDPGAKHDLYELFAGLAREGVAIVMLSTDLDELLDLMDRVLVFREGEVFAELPRSGLTRHALVASFFGRRDGADG